MSNIIGVRFKKAGKIEYYKIDEQVKIYDQVLANTTKGLEIGRVVKINEELEEMKEKELPNIERVVTKKDLETQKNNDEKAKEALKFCKELVKEQKLNMKILTAEYTFDMSKLCFYFVSEERVDFRDLVKVLASKFKARIELRQIGVRDEVKEYPNLGICGREVCCRSFLQDFEPVTIKMAKEQGLQINMAKLSGSCGKLMCCLRYEYDNYVENLKIMPKMGEYVTVDDEPIKGKVISVDALNMKVRVKFKDEDNKESERIETYKFKDKRLVKE